MDASVNIPSLIVNDVKEAEAKLIPEKSRKRYLKEYGLFNVLNVVCVYLIFSIDYLFGFRARRINGVKCGLFSNPAPLGQATLRVG